MLTQERTKRTLDTLRDLTTPEGSTQKRRTKMEKNQKMEKNRIDENIRKIKVANHEVARHRRSGHLYVVFPGGAFTNCGMFYHDRETTRRLHLQNLRSKRCGNQLFDYHQLIAMNQEITNKRVYTRMVNAYIKGEI